MTTTTITVTKRDGSEKSVESPYTDMQAIVKLNDLCFSGAAPLNRSSFAVSLANGASQGRGLSEKQTAWVHILVCEHEQRRSRQAESDANARTLPQVRAMLDEAGESLQIPKVNLQTASGQRVRLSRAGDRARTPGVINITDGKPFGENVWYGRIALDGKLHESRHMTEEVRAVLLALDADHEAVISAYGHNTGSCSFCSRTLTDGRSVAMGYGPICAENYGLPWGDERASSAVEVHADEVEA